ncbi:MAG: T9SS type A sorting domain-containing protein [bacterium]|nr:T9SS type A sorting domain-containing protein [bacterium]
MIAILLVPSLVFAGSSKFGAAKATMTGDNLITVPLVVSNQANLAAMDIPLKFSEGVTLKEVSFVDTRVEYFDLKVANIDNEASTVNIGLLPQLTANKKDDLAAGTGTVANLIFEVNDPNVTEVTVEAYTTENPHHDLIFVYHVVDDAGNRTLRTVTRDGASDDRIDFESFTVEVAKEALPTAFALNQNYPNPFNPTTTIGFELPKASQVKLSIYNVLGQEVDVLVDRHMEAGRQSVEWDASAKASGLYFYRIEAGDFNETKKMMMLK